MSFWAMQSRGAHLGMAPVRKYGERQETASQRRRRKANEQRRRAARAED